MALSASYVTQTPYFSAAFNTAVFDGPLRIYFAQYQESSALKFYFRLQKQLREELGDLFESYRHNGRSIFVMVYPNRESFHLSFDQFGAVSDGPICVPLGDDHVIGFVGDYSDAISDQVFGGLKDILGSTETNA